MSTAVTPATIRRYISDHWDQTVRQAPRQSNVLPVPHRYTVPCPAGAYQVLFYWDTYFTNLGLLRDDRVELAKSNCDALLWLVRVLGFVPNDIWRGDTNRSQPPYLSAMVRDVYDRTGDKEWLRDSVGLIETEWKFWETRRKLPIGLNRYGHDADAATLRRFAREVIPARCGTSRELSDEVALEIGGHFLAEAESGADFSPVHECRIDHFATPELNSLLWTLEKNMVHFARELGEAPERSAVWQERADARRELIFKYLWDDEAGMFRSYDTVFQRHAPLADAKNFQPLWAGLATGEQAARVRATLPQLEREFGIAATSDYPEKGKFQWGYPVGWPPLFWIVASGLRRYGFDEDALRIARKYRELQLRTFARTGQLWEKFDVETGDVSHGEYKANPMLGWTAGVFIALEEMLAPDEPG